jgi:hypothetical protein
VAARSSLGRLLASTSTSARACPRRPQVAAPSRDVMSLSCGANAPVSPVRDLGSRALTSHVWVVLELRQYQASDSSQRLNALVRKRQTHPPVCFTRGGLDSGFARCVRWSCECPAFTPASFRLRSQGRGGCLKAGNARKLSCSFPRLFEPRCLTLPARQAVPLRPVRETPPRMRTHRRRRCVCPHPAAPFTDVRLVVS